MPLSHSAAQKSLLVQVFLASILCLLHFANDCKKAIVTLLMQFLFEPKPINSKAKHPFQ